MNHEILENKLERFFSGCKFISLKKFGDSMPRLVGTGRIRGGLYLLAIISVIMTAAQLCAQENYILYTGKSSLKDRREASAYIQSADLLVSKLISSDRKHTGKLQIMLQPITETDNRQAQLYIKAPTGLFLNLPLNSNWQNDQSALKPLLRGLICIRCGIPPTEKTLAAIPDWLLTGLAYRLKTQQTIAETLTPYVLQPHANVNFLASEGKMPSLEQIVDHPASQNELTAYAAYAELCDLLIEICDKRNPIRNKNIFDLLIALSLLAPDGNNQAAIFNQLQNAPPEALKIKNFTPEKWFKDEAAAFTVSYLSPSAIRLVMTNFRENMEIDFTILNKDSKQEEIHCRLEQLSENLDQIENRFKTIDGIANRFKSMSYNSPVILKAPLFRIAELTAGLTKLNAASFPKAVRDAENDFYTALDKHIEIETYLKAQEIASLPPGVRYDSYMQTMEELDQTEYKRMNDINKYLDIMESKRKDSK